VPRLLVVASELSWRFLVCLAAAVAIVYGITQVGFAVIPVVVALLLSTLLVPPARALERRGVPRTIAAVVVFAGGLLLIVSVGLLLAKPVSDEFDALGERVRGGADELGRILADAPLAPSEREIQKQIDSVDDRIRENSSSIGSGVASGVAAAGQILAALVITLVVLFFFIQDGPRLWAWVVRALPPGRRPAVEELGDRSWKVLTSYVRGVVFVAAVDAIGIGLALAVIGVPLVIPLAALTFILAFVPLIGAVVAGIAAALVALVSDGAFAALLVVAAVVFVQQLEGNVLYPIIVGRTLELHPIVVLLSVTVGGLLYGIVGAALAVPVATVAVAAIKVVGRYSVQGEVAVGPPPVQPDP
jgi:predicted PurR-regulated permease PerM